MAEVSSSRPQHTSPGFGASKTRPQPPGSLESLDEMDAGLSDRTFAFAEKHEGVLRAIFSTGWTTYSENPRLRRVRLGGGAV